MHYADQTLQPCCLPDTVGSLPWAPGLVGESYS